MPRTASNETSIKKAERDITSTEAIEAVLSKASVCRLGMCDGHIPYVVPLNFAHKGTTIYLHCAREGRKVDILRKNPNVCFQIDRDGGYLPSKDPDNACRSDYRYQSLIATGTASFLETAAARQEALDALCMKYHGTTAPMKPMDAGPCVLALTFDKDDISVKQSGDWHD